ncbi:MAG TPA: LptF/LptG family permease [Gemmatimonadales bacterium]|nr:LptF/LptG family permease [Gemmatimonadales bacterium]
MRLLDRYLLRQLLPPLIFAFTAMTSIMLLNQVARRFGQLVGKGLPWTVIGEVFLLCLPFIIAMTLPMAVLIAMLYTYSHLAADSEITAMRASGVSVLQMLRPALLAGGLLAVVNFWFTDQILPDSNAKLRNLLINIQRKKPTLEMREQVINEIPPSGLFLRASRIDPNTGRLRNVTIYDMAATDGRRIIYADSGVMGFSSDATDLTLRLFDGSIHAFKATEPNLMQVTDFTVNNILVKDVSNRLDLESSDGVRGDREMSTCEMMDVVWEAEYETHLSDQRRATALQKDLRSLMGLGPPPPLAPPPPPRPKGYCRVFRRVGGWLKTQTVGEDSSTQAAAPVDDNLAPKPGSDQLPVTPLKTGFPQTVRQASIPRRPVPLTQWGEISASLDESRTSALRADQYEVEVHKKWAISAACLVFAIVGIPMALRFPRGGMGLVIGGGLFVFSIYYVGLIAGEGLGNKDIVSPATAMWAPNIIFAVLGIFGLYRVSRESGSTRGGDLADLWESLTGRFRRKRVA